MTPKTILENMGSIGASLIIWILTGFYGLLGGLAYLELGLLIKTSGGEYTYLKYTYGNKCGYILSFIYILVLRPIGACIMAVTFSEYLISIITEETLDHYVYFLLLVRYILDF